MKYAERLMRFNSAGIDTENPESLNALLPILEGFKGARDASQVSQDAFFFMEEICGRCSSDGQKARRALEILRQAFCNSANPHVQAHSAMCTCMLGLPEAYGFVMRALKGRMTIPPEHLAEHLKALLYTLCIADQRDAIIKLGEMLGHPREGVGKFAAEHLVMFASTQPDARVILAVAIRDGNRHAASVFLKGARTEPTHGLAGEQRLMRAARRFYELSGSPSFPVERAQLLENARDSLGQRRPARPLQIREFGRLRRRNPNPQNTGNSDARVIKFGGN